MKKRLLAISDIHGCCSEFIALLKRAAYNPLLDQLILLGDYVDRGPDSFQVVELVIQLVNEGAIALRGNHDDYFVKMVKENNRFSYNIIEIGRAHV
jgi:serine/threonine protein phosphatase 1